MDTKSRNIKYSPAAKIFAAVIVWICFLIALGSGSFLLINREYLSVDNYYDTYIFQDNFGRLVHNVVELNVKLKNEVNIIASGQSPDIISNNLDRLNRIKSNLSGTVNFTYYIKNTETGETFTNVSGADAVGLIKSQRKFFYSDGSGSNFGLFSYGGDIHDMLSGKPFEVYAAVMEPLKEGDIFYDSFTKFTMVKSLFPYVVTSLISSIILMISAFVYLACVTGIREKGGEISLSYVDRIFTDVHTLLVFIAAVISLLMITSTDIFNHIEGMIFASIVLSIDIFIGLSYLLSMIRQLKRGQIIKNSLIFKICSSIKKFIVLNYHGKVFKGWTLFLLLSYGLTNALLFAAAIRGGGFNFLLFMLLWLAFNGYAAYFTAKSLISLSQIMVAAKEISSGNLDYVLDISSISTPFLNFAKDILNIQGGLKKAVDDAVKGERMKTELITNVSHDLKTPLTSIINYVDLLKKENLNDENAVQYVSILEEKSARLKQLVEDLIEASKASSGNLSVNPEKIDLHELVIQACGEYEEKFKGASLDMRVDSNDKNIFILADGKHMWRILENLLSNVVKYSMPNSRVYINMDRDDSYGILTVKNISALPLNIPPEVLTERFVRGDTSRTTEGSGLGLSIAQSLSHLQGGKFSIDIDGDLFKATVKIPLWKE